MALSPVSDQGITKSNADLMPFGTVKANCSIKTLIEKYVMVFVQGDSFYVISCKVSTILLLLQCVNIRASLSVKRFLA